MNSIPDGINLGEIFLAKQEVCPKRWELLVYFLGIFLLSLCTLMSIFITFKLSHFTLKGWWPTFEGLRRTFLSKEYDKGHLSMILNTLARNCLHSIPRSVSHCMCSSAGLSQLRSQCQSFSEEDSSTYQAMSTLSSLSVKEAEAGHL